MMFWLARPEIKSIIGAVIIAVPLGSSALAAPAQDLPNVKRDLGECSRSPVPEKSVDACTALINSGKLKASALSATYFLRALAYHRLKRTAEANADFAEAARADPDGIFGLVARGTLSCDKKETASAISDLSEVIRRAPKWGLGYLVRGSCHHWLGQYREAVEDVTNALAAMAGAAARTRAYLHLVRGDALAASGKDEEALQDLSKALQTDIHLAGEVYLIRGRIYAKRREWVRAAEEWGRWTALNPNMAYGFKKQGDALDYAGRSKQAIAAYTKAIGLEKNPKLLDEYYLDRAAAFSNLEEWPNAIEDYAEAIKLAPTAAAYRRRGAALLISGSDKLIEALTDLRRANELDPKDSYAVLWMAIAEARLGRLNVEEFKRLAEALAPKWPRDVVLALLNEPASEQPQGGEKLNELRNQGRKCELEYYLGAVRLAQGNREEGIRRLQAAIASGAKEYIEYQAARIELKRLGIEVSGSSN